jgi:elongation factor P hydroxylase
VRKFELVPTALRSAKSAANGDDRIAAAAPWLERALDAVGGRERVETLAGFTTEATTTAEKAPEIDEIVHWSANGTAHRQRKVLGSVVDTDFTARAWTESSGSEKVQLSPSEARWQMCEIERHPLALLIAWAKGQLNFRLVATRVVDDRERIVLEATGQRFDRLRVELDRESALVRAVEAWTTSPQGTPSSLVDTWSDERSVDGGLRLPFRRVTVVDDGQSRRVTTYTKITPARE